MKRLLLVEDDADMRTLIRLTLEPEPRAAITQQASSAAEALASVADDEPDLIILDHSLDGDVTGLALAPQLKQRAPRAKILVFTSHDIEREAAGEPSIDGFLSKSQTAWLLYAVRDLLSL
jgi:DNA-binding NarL/FixJ family response regulator